MIIPTYEQWIAMSDYHRARFAIDILNTPTRCDDVPGYIARWVAANLISGLPETARRMLTDDVHKGRVRL